MLILSFVGTTFLMFGAIVLALHFYYKFNGKKHQGQIIAIEKYSSAFREEGVNQTRTYYRPIYEYYFNGQKIWFPGGGSSVIHHQIGDKVTVYGLPQGAEFCWADANTALAIGGFCLLAGIIPIAVSFFEYDDWYRGMIIPMIAPILILIGQLSQRTKKVMKVITEGFLKQSRLETLETLAGREVYWTKVEINREVGRYHQVGFKIAVVFVVIALGINYFLWTTLSTELQEEIINVFENVPQLPELFRYVDEGNFIAFLISSVFSLILISSVGFSLLKRKKLISR